MPVGNLPLPLGSVLTGQPEVIGSTVLTAITNQIRFDFQPIYRAIFISMWANNGTADLIYPQFRLNNDSGANYQIAAIYATGASQSNSNLANETSIYNYGIVGGILTPQALITKSAASVKAQYIDLESGRSTGADINLGMVAAEWNNTTDLLNRIDAFATFFTSPTRYFGVGTSVTLWGYRL